MGYDKYANLTSGLVGDIMSYDVANRMTTASNGSQSVNYVYDASNLRMYSRNASTGAETIYFFGADGKKLATYGPAIAGTTGNYTVLLTFQSNNVYQVGALR